jgi:hypothetical protein
LVMDAKFDNYCGLYCDASPIQLFGETGRIDDFVACLSNIPQRGAEMRRMQIRHDLLWLPGLPYPEMRPRESNLSLHRLRSLSLSAL